MPEETGIAGLPAGGSTLVSGLPTAPAEEKPPPDWPLVLVMVLIAAVGGFLLVAGQWGDVASVRPAKSFGVPTLPAASTASTASAAEGSYLEPARLADALEEAGRRAGPGARIQLMRVDVGQVWVVLDVRGRQRVLRFTPGGVTDDAGGRASSAETPITEVDPRAPRRMVRRLRERFGVTPEQIDYFALTGWTSTWSAFLKDGTHFSANGRGGQLVRVG